MMIKNKIRFSTTQIILLSFLAAVFVGSVLLALHISSAGGEAVPYLDAHLVRDVSFGSEACYACCKEHIASLRPKGATSLCEA